LIALESMNLRPQSSISQISLSIL